MGRLSHTPPTVFSPRKCLLFRGKNLSFSRFSIETAKLGLEEAGTLGMRRRVVLPFNRKRFRETSVVDRPGDWGNLYDHIVDAVEANGDIVTLSFNSDDTNAYSAANVAILDEATALCRQLQLETVAVLVWDGSPRGEEDLTQSFGDKARARGFSVIEIKTL